MASALEAWAARGLDELHLPSGIVVRVHLADAATLIRLGILPGELLGIALAAQKGIAEPTDEQLAEYARLKREVAVASVRQIQTDDGWEDIRLTVAQADEMELPEGDLNILAAIALREISVERVNAVTAGRPPAPEEADATVNGYAEFRGERPGDEPGSGGEDVRPEPGTDVPGPGRPGPRGGRRRGGRDAAGV